MVTGKDRTGGAGCNVDGMETGWKTKHDVNRMERIQQEGTGRDGYLK